MFIWQKLYSYDISYVIFDKIAAIKAELGD